MTTIQTKGRWIHYAKNRIALKGNPEKTAPKAIPKTTKECTPKGLSVEPLTPVEHSIRDAWKETIAQRTQAKVFLTVGFKVQCTNEQAINALNFLLKAINNFLFNHSYGRDPKAGLTGMCICEPHMLSLDFRGQLHFHMLLDDMPELQDVDAFREIVHKQMRRVVTKNGWHMLDETVVDVREVTDIKELAEYLTKTARMHTWKRLENLFFIEPKGLTGVGVLYQKNARNY